MKNVFKVILIAFLLPILSAKATNDVDTTKKLLAAVTIIPAKPVLKKVVIQPSNVAYPAILESSREQSAAYVEKFSVSRKDYLVRTYKKSKKFFPKVNSILKRYKVPNEFAVLMALESSFNPKAKSSAGAYGYWQFMDEVAKEYGLKIVEEAPAESTKVKKAATAGAVKKPVDEREHFHKSTAAAARYLRDRTKSFGNDWLLIAASYNYGTGNVRNAMARTGLTNPSFWDIQKYLPAETKAYVLNFIALNVVFKNYNKFLAGQLVFNDVVTEVEEEYCPPIEPKPVSTL